jgi:hypothetical protein
MHPDIGDRVEPVAALLIEIRIGKRPPADENCRGGSAPDAQLCPWSARGTADTRGSKSALARLLGVHRDTIHR